MASYALSLLHLLLFTSTTLARAPRHDERPVYALCSPRMLYGSSVCNGTSESERKRRLSVRKTAVRVQSIGESVACAPSKGSIFHCEENSVSDCVDDIFVHYGRHFGRQGQL